MDIEQLKHFIEAALLAASEPQSIDQLQKLAESLPGGTEVGKPALREALKALTDDYAERGIELVEVASGFRVQVRSEMGPLLQGLFEQRPPRYSRALFETLALIAYRQPITRGEIEDVRGVAVSSNIVRTLLEREWIRVVGHRDVPGKPAMFGTTRAFLDYFNLKKLDDLPSLAELTDMESLRIQLDLPEVDDGTGSVDGAEEQDGFGELHVAATGGAGESPLGADGETTDAAADETGDDAAEPMTADSTQTAVEADGDTNEEDQDSAPARAGADSR